MSGCGRPHDDEINVLRLGTGPFQRLAPRRGRQFAEGVPHFTGGQVRGRVPSPRADERVDPWLRQLVGTEMPGQSGVVDRRTPGNAVPMGMGTRASIVILPGQGIVLTAWSTPPLKLSLFRKNAELAMKRAVLKRSAALWGTDAMRGEAGRTSRPRGWNTAPAGGVLSGVGVPQTWFYKWRHGDPSLRHQHRVTLAAADGLAGLAQIRWRCHRDPH